MADTVKHNLQVPLALAGFGFEQTGKCNLFMDILIAIRGFFRVVGHVDGSVFVIGSRQSIYILKPCSIFRLRSGNVNGLPLVKIEILELDAVL